jgi:hypothetical protein
VSGTPENGGSAPGRCFRLVYEKDAFVVFLLLLIHTNKIVTVRALIIAPSWLKTTGETASHTQAISWNIDNLMTIHNYLKKEAYLLLAVLSLFSLISCQKQPKLSFGQDYIGDNGSANIVLVDTATVLMSTVRVDSTATAGTGFLQIGAYNDPYFGKISSRAFLQVGIPGSFPGINQFDIYDSIGLVMLFKKGNPYYGDTTATMTYRVNQVTDLYQLNDATSQRGFYSKDSFNIDPTPLGSTSFRLYPSIPLADQGTGDTVKIKLDHDLGARMFNMVFNNNDSIKKAQNFLNWFHGLCISPDANSKGIIYGFADSILLRIYYREVGAVTSFKTIDFGITNKSFQFNNIVTDRTGSPLAKLNPVLSGPGQNPTSTLSDSIGGGYVQSITGLNVKLTFPYLNGIAHRQDYLSVIRAILTVKPLPQSFSTTWTLPPQLSIDYTDFNNLIGSPLPSSTTGQAQAGNMTVNYGAPLNTVYTYDVTNFIKPQITNVSPTAPEQGLMLSVPSPNSTNSFARAVLADRSTPVNQRVTLTVYYLSLYPHN